jgi:glutamyl-tRNA reductase
MSHSLANARVLAEACHATAAPFDQFDAQLAIADVVVSATACAQPILTVERLRHIQARRASRPMIILDLAVPRNVAPEVAQIEGIRLYDIDAIGRIITSNHHHRAAAAEQCETILDEEVTAFSQWLGDARISPLIAQMFQCAHSVRDAELDRMLRKCPELTAQQREATEQLVNRLVGKFLHPYVVGLRNSPEPMISQVARAWHEETEED